MAKILWQSTISAKMTGVWILSCWNYTAIGSPSLR